MTRPFDKAKYNALLNGLEAAEVRFSQVREISSFRVDAEFYKKLYLQEDERRGHFDNICIGECAFVTDGQHGYHEVDPNSPIAHLTAKNTRGWFANRINADPLAKWVDDNNKRSSLKTNDVLLSTRGTVGLCAIVKKEALPANIDQDIARIALEKDAPLQPEYLVTYLNSKFGQDWILRNSTGMVQQGLILESVRQIPVPHLSTKFQESISRTVCRAHQLSQESISANKNAYDQLLATLKMDAAVETSNCNAVSFSSSFAVSGRLDAEFYQPKYDELERHIRDKGNCCKLSDIASFIQRGRQPVYATSGLRVVNSRHVQSGYVDLTGERYGIEPDSDDLIIRKNDVLLNGTGRGTIGRCSAYLSDKQALPDNHVTIIRSSTIDPVYLSVYLNSIAGQMQVERFYKGSSGQIELYPEDIGNFLIWNAPKDVQHSIRQAVETSLSKKEESFQCLEKAKRAVEIAIEKGEEAAMAYLEGRNYVEQAMVHELGDQAPYFSIDAVRRWLADQKMTYKPDTVKTYLSRQKKAGKIFDAGRGWYSSLSESYQLDTAPVEKLVGELKDTFPLLEFACWSTAQLNDLLRHQLAKHVQFAYVERDAMNSVADWLRSNGYRPCVNPGKKERQAFVIEENSVVVLPLTSEAPSQDGFALIEKVLVDVLSDASDFSIINIPEFMAGASRSINRQRVDMTALMRYSSRRKTGVEELVKGAVIH